MTFESLPLHPQVAFVYTPNIICYFGMIAGGTSITPILQVVKAIIKRRAAGEQNLRSILSIVSGLSQLPGGITHGKFLRYVRQIRHIKMPR